MKQEKTRKGMLAKLAAVLTALVLAMSFLPISVLGTQSAFAAQSGALSSTVSWSLDDSGNLTIYPTNGTSGSYSFYNDMHMVTPWAGNSIQTVTVSPGVTVTDSLQGLFSAEYDLTSADLSGLSTSSVTAMGGMFADCSSLTSVDLSGFDLSSVTDMDYMFSGCTSLETISVGSGWTRSSAPFADQSESNFYRVDDQSNTQYVKSASLPTGVAATYSVNQYTAPPAPAAPSIIVNKAINVPASVDLTGLTYTFDFQAAAPVANEESAFVVPTITAAQAAATGFDSVNQAAGSQVDIPTVTLTAANSTLTTGNDSVRTISGTVNLPDPNLFGHAGVYAYTVTETVTGANANDSWDNDLSQYKVRLYVINDGNGGLVYDSATTNGGADTMMIEVLKDIDGNNAGSAGSSVQAGAKVNALDYTNTYDKTVPFQVKKLVSGDYANRTHRFSFDLTLDFPDYVTSGTYAYTTSYGGSGTVTVANGTATISGFQLAADETLDFASLPVGTVYTVVESTPSEGVNDYVPSATYTYSGIGAANSGYETATNNVTAGTAGATYTVNKTDGAAQNLNTILGAGSGNRVDVTNTLDNPPSPTGVLVSTLPFVAILAIPAILAAALYITRRRDEEDSL